MTLLTLHLTLAVLVLALVITVLWNLLKGGRIQPAPVKPEATAEDWKAIGDDFKKVMKGK